MIVFTSKRDGTAAQLDHVAADEYDASAHVEVERRGTRHRFALGDHALDVAARLRRDEPAAEVRAGAARGRILEDRRAAGEEEARVDGLPGIGEREHLGGAVLAAKLAERLRAGSG